MKRTKKLRDQIVVITGASSGIGLVTAKMAAARGAKVVLSARNARSLATAVQEIEAGGGSALAVPVDVSDSAQVERLAVRTIDAFGAIDTWVNNAAVSMYGRLWEIPLEDARRQMDVVFWGMVHGSLTAFRHMLGNPEGGGIINVTSVLADRAIPLQGIYCASKHAVKAFTDTLRMEIEAANIPIALTQIKPGSIDTPFFDKARDLFAHEPQPVPPVYAPELVANAILESCERPRRDVIISGMGKIISAADRVAPRLADRYMEQHSAESAQLSDIPVRPGRRDNLWKPVDDDGGERSRRVERQNEGEQRVHLERAPRRSPARSDGRARDSGDCLDHP